MRLKIKKIEKKKYPAGSRACSLSIIEAHKLVAHNL